MGYAIGAAVVSGKPVVAIEGDSAFGFSGMEIETICRYHLPIVVVVFNNGGIYRGDDVNRGGGADPGPTVLMKEAHYEKLIEAFGGVGYYAVDPRGLATSRRCARRAEAGPDQLRDRPHGGDGERPHRQPQPAKQHPTQAMRGQAKLACMPVAHYRLVADRTATGRSLPRETRGAVMEATTLAHLLADTTSAQPAIVVEPSGVEISYRALADEVERLAEDFGGTGLQAGDAVALVLPNGPGLLILLLALARANLAAAPLSPAFKADELRGLSRRRAAVIVVDGADGVAASCAAEAAVPLWTVSLDRSGGVRLAGIQRLHRGAAGAPKPDDVALFMHTSGDGGQPRSLPGYPRRTCSWLFSRATSPRTMRSRPPTAAW